MLPAGYRDKYSKTVHKTLGRIGITAFCYFETVSHLELIASPGDGSGI
jgi:hypothetical protein